MSCWNVKSIFARLTDSLPDPYLSVRIHASKATSICVFKRILVEDFTSIRFSKANSDAFSSHGNASGATAGCKVDLAFHLLGGEIIYNQLHPSTKQDKTIGITRLIGCGRETSSLGIWDISASPTSACQQGGQRQTSSRTPFPRPAKRTHHTRKNPHPERLKPAGEQCFPIHAKSGESRRPVSSAVAD